MYYIVAFYTFITWEDDENECINFYFFLNNITAASNNQITDLLQYLLNNMWIVWLMNSAGVDKCIIGLKSKTHLNLSFPVNPCSNSWDWEGKQTTTTPELCRVNPDVYWKLWTDSKHLLLKVFLSWKLAWYQLFPEPSWPQVDHQGIMIMKATAVHSCTATWAG